MANNFCLRAMSISATVDGMSTKDTSAPKLREPVNSAEVFLKLRAGNSKPSDMKPVLQQAPKDEAVATDR